MTLKLLPYFCNSLIDPVWEVLEIIDNQKHKEYSNLQDDINSIDEDELEYFAIANDIDNQLLGIDDLDLKRRVVYLIDILNKSIERERIKMLSSKEVRPRPYNSENLKSISITQDNLVDLSLFDAIGDRLIFNEYGYRLCPSICQSNSSYWLYLKLCNLVAYNNKTLYIRLDPLIEIERTIYNPLSYKMNIYGKKLRWYDIVNMTNDIQGQFLNDNLSISYGITDYIWHSVGTEIHFTCEELPKPEYYDIRGSRYFHAIIDKKTGCIIHCDGAMRIYNLNTLMDRQKLHIKDAEVRKMGKRIKIFLINDILANQDFTEVLKSFYVWNDDVQNYILNLEE